MKKDKAWLQNEINYVTARVYGSKLDIVLEIIGLIDQLDEPEVLSLDWIDDNKKDSGVHSIGYYVPIGKLHDLLVPKQDEPEVLSQEWIGENSYDRWMLEGTMDDEDETFVSSYDLQNLIVPKQDEPETLSQEWIDENKVARIDNLRKMTTSDVVPVEKLKNLLVPKQDKPVIPKFIANLIESYRKKTLAELINDVVYSSDEDSQCFRRWFHEEMGFESNYSEFLSRSWLDGYEVEEEQKYQVIIRDGEYIRLYLCKHGDNVLIGTNDNYIEKCPEVTYLTEQEIKDYDERYWAFAQEVTE